MAKFTKCRFPEPFDKMISTVEIKCFHIASPTHKSATKKWAAMKDNKRSKGLIKKVVFGSVGAILTAAAVLKSLGD